MTILTSEEFEQQTGGIAQGLRLAASFLEARAHAAGRVVETSRLYGDVSALRSAAQSLEEGLVEIAAQTLRDRMPLTVRAVSPSWGLNIYIDRKPPE